MSTREVRSQVWSWGEEVYPKLSTRNGKAFSYMKFDFRKFLKEFSPENGGNANFVENEYDVRNARERRSKSNELLQ